jgi:hypothetical protein
MIPRRCRKDRGITVLDQKRRSSQSEPETVSAETETQPRQRANGGLSHHIRTSLHPRSICIGETGFLGPETDRAWACNPPIRGVRAQTGLWQISVHDSDAVARATTRTWMGVLVSGEKTSINSVRGLTKKSPPAVRPTGERVQVVS